MATLKCVSTVNNYAKFPFIGKCLTKGRKLEPT